MFILPIDKEVNLGLLQACHAEELFRLYDRNRARFEQWMPYVSPLRTTGDTRAFILDALGRFGAERGALCGIFYRGQLAGEVQIRIRDDRNSSVAYTVDRQFEGKGLVTRAVTTLCRYAFDAWKQRRIELRCSPENLRSQRVAERAGFTREGLLRQYIEFDGKVQDMIIYSRLRSD